MKREKGITIFEETVVENFPNPRKSNVSRINTKENIKRKERSDSLSI